MTDRSTRAARFVLGRLGCACTKLRHAIETYWTIHFGRHKARGNGSHSEAVAKSCPTAARLFAARRASFRQYFPIRLFAGRDRVVGIDACVRPALAENLTTICRSFTELSSDLRARFCGGSRLAKSCRSNY